MTFITHHADIFFIFHACKSGLVGNLLILQKKVYTHLYTLILLSFFCSYLLFIKNYSTINCLHVTNTNIFFYNNYFYRSNTCPQCREKTSARNIHRIYFNFSNDDSIVTDPITLQSTIDSQNFNLTLLKKEKNDLTELNSELEMQKLSLQQEVWSCEGKIKDKNSAILALKEQLKYCKAQCANVADKEHEIKMLNTKLKELQK